MSNPERKQERKSAKAFNIRAREMARSTHGTREILIAEYAQVSPVEGGAFVEASIFVPIEKEIPVNEENDQL